MIFEIYKASDRYNEEVYEKEINSLEELLEFIQKCGYDLIVGPGFDKPAITIYDDYIE